MTTFWKPFVTLLVLSAMSLTLDGKEATCTISPDTGIGKRMMLSGKISCQARQSVPFYYSLDLLGFNTKT